MISIQGQISAVFSRPLDVEKVFKENGRGQVLLVRDTTSGTRYILRSFSGNAEVYHRLQAAACPHVPRIEAVAEQDGQVWVLEEYIQGDTLAFLLEVGPLPADDAGRVLVQLCDALEILHSLGIVHRDIKPENVILRGSEAVLIDFDVSRLCKPEQPADTRVMGTAGYAAPEQFGFTQTDRRVDIYALGILLNELLTKQHPSKALTEGPFRPVVEKCIEVNMDKRYDSVVQLRRDLQKAASAGKKRRPRLFLLLAVLVLAGAAAFFAGSRRQAEPAPEPASAQSAVEDWPEDPEPDALRFRYDLDGDGTEEEYLFGVGFLMVEDGQTLLRQIRQDEFRLGPSDSQRREVTPCVWRYGADGALEPAEDFTKLLENAEVTLWRVSPPNVEAPEIFPLEDSAWQGGIKMNFMYRQAGTWLYEARAELDGQSLSATAVSILVQE